MSLYEPTPQRLPSGGVQIPGGGERPTGVVLGGPHEVELDAIAALEERVTPTAPVLIWRHLGVPMADGEVYAGSSQAKLVSANAGNGVDPINGYPSPHISTTGTAWSFAYLVDLPQGAVLQEVRVFWYESDDGDLTSVAVHVRARDYSNTIDPGGGFEGQDIPDSTFLGADTTIVPVEGGMSRCDVETTHTVDRSESGQEIVVYVRGNGAARFMTKVVCGFDFVENDQGAA